MAVGIGDGCRFSAGAAAGTPRIFAGRHLDADGMPFVVAVSHVDVVSDANHAAVMILELVPFQEILFLGFQLAPLFHDLEEPRAGTVAAGAENIVATNDGGGDVRGAVGDRAIVPEELAGFGIDADQTAADDRDVFLNPG